MKYCQQKFSGKNCELLICAFESIEALEDGSVDKEKFLEAYEHFIDKYDDSNKEILRQLLPKAFDTCQSLGMNAAAFKIYF